MAQTVPIQVRIPAIFIGIGRELLAVFEIMPPPRITESALL
jgi:hypothetical protein